MDNNDTIKVPRAGGADPYSGQPGDLYLTLQRSSRTIILHSRSSLVLK